MVEKTVLHLKHTHLRLIMSKRGGLRNMAKMAGAPSPHDGHGKLRRSLLPGRPLPRLNALAKSPLSSISSFSTVTKREPHLILSSQTRVLRDWKR